MSNGSFKLAPAARLWQSQMDALETEIKRLLDLRRSIEEQQHSQRKDLSAKHAELARPGETQGEQLNAFHTFRSMAAMAETRLSTDLQKLSHALAAKQDDLQQVKRKLKQVDLLREQFDREQKYHADRQMEAEAAYLFLIRSSQTPLDE